MDARRQMFGTERLEAVLRETGAAGGAERLMAAVRAAVDAFAAGAEQYDDLTMLGFRRTVRPRGRPGPGGDAPAPATRQKAATASSRDATMVKSPENPEISKTSATKGGMEQSTILPSSFSSDLSTLRNTRSPALETYSLAEKSATSLRAPSSSSPLNSASTSPGAGRVDPGGQGDEGHFSDGLDLHGSPSFSGRGGSRGGAYLILPPRGSGTASMSTS